MSQCRNVWSRHPDVGRLEKGASSRVAERRGRSIGGGRQAADLDAREVGERGELDELLVER
jgi:hypothetical protein